MAERKDTNTLAKFIVDQATGEKPIRNPDPKAIERGQQRANALSPEKRREIARNAATKRWAKE
jgi:hypothetical protein